MRGERERERERVNEGRERAYVYETKRMGGRRGLEGKGGQYR